jgi:hypothetical protein
MIPRHTDTLVFFVRSMLLTDSSLSDVTVSSAYLSEYGTYSDNWFKLMSCQFCDLSRRVLAKLLNLEVRVSHKGEKRKHPWSRT